MYRYQPPSGSQAPTTSGAIAHHSRQQTPVLQPPLAYDSGYASNSTPRVSDGMGQNPGLPLPGQPMQNQSCSFDTTGQIAPPGMKPRVTATFWEDEGTRCFQIEARGVCVARREDNHWINATKLLQVAGMTRGRRDGILKSEKVRHVITIGPLHLKGVWLPFERALDFANKERITDLLYPLFVHNIEALLYDPTNQNYRANNIAAEERQRQVSIKASYTSEKGDWPSVDSGLTLITSPSPTSINSANYNAIFGATGMMDNMATENSQWSQQGTKGVAIDPGLPDSHNSSLYHTPASTPPPSPSLGYTTPQPNETQFPGSHPYEDSALPRLNMEIFEPADPGSKAPEFIENEGLGLPSIASHLKKKEAHRTDEHPSTTADIGPVIEGSNSDAEDASGASSCGTGSDLSSSSDDDEGLLRRSSRKRVLLDRLMGYFYSVFSSCPSPSAPFRTHGSGSSSSRSRPGSEIDTGSQQQTSYTAAQHINQLKRRLPDDDEDRKDDDKKKRPRIARPNDDTPRRLACPYFKNNPQVYQQWRSCPGPGWGTVHRIKEHMYRAHALPISCPRCHETFETDRLKDDHVGAAQRCEMQEKPTLEGLDSTQRDLLKSRKKAHKHMTEVDKWNEMYLIVFPQSDPVNIPTPYYEFSAQDPDQPHSPSSEFALYEQFLRRELPTRVRQQLEIRIEEALDPVEEGLRGQIVDVVRDMQLQLFEMYKSSRSAAMAATAGIGVQQDGSQAHETSPTQSANQSHQLPMMETSTLDDMLQAYQPVPPYTGDFFDFDGQLWDFSMMQPDRLGVDSGYGGSLLSDHGKGPGPPRW